MSRSPLFSVFFVWWILFHFSCASVPTTKKKLNVGIIGAGIGGGATAYYLRKFAKGFLFFLSLIQEDGIDLDISVFEKNDYIGGRLKHITLEGTIMEVGGDAFSRVNRYVYDLSQELGLTYDESGTDGNGLQGLWDGKTWFPVKYTPYLSDAKILGLVGDLYARLYLNYIERGDSTFHTFEEFLSYGGLDKWTSVSSQEIINSYSIDPTLVWETWEPLSRVIFDQDLSCNGFAGVTVLLSALTEPFSIEGGNSLMVEKLFTASQAKMFLKNPVKKLDRDARGKYVIITPTGEADELDAVVVAAPLEFTDISFNFTLPSFRKRQYHHWFVSMVVAQKPSENFFGISPVPDVIFTPSNSSAPFNILAVQQSLPSGRFIYKLFSNENITSILPEMFVGLTEFYVQYWPYTFPDLSPLPPNETYQPILLKENLYSLNGIESIATAMGASTPSGRNIALLMREQWRKSFL